MNFEFLGDLRQFKTTDSGKIYVIDDDGVHNSKRIEAYSDAAFAFGGVYKIKNNVLSLSIGAENTGTEINKISLDNNITFFDMRGVELEYTYENGVYAETRKLLPRAHQRAGVELKYNSKCAFILAVTGTGDNQKFTNLVLIGDEIEDPDEIPDFIVTNLAEFPGSKIYENADAQLSL